MSEEPRTPTQETVTGQGDGEQAAGKEAEPAGQAPGSATKGWRKQIARANEILDTSASTITNLQTILTVVGALFGALAFLNLEFGLLGSMNTLFHNVAAFLHRAKLPLAGALIITALANVFWMLRRGRVQRTRRGWAPTVVALALAIGILALKPSRYDVAVLTYLPSEGTAIPESIMGGKLAAGLADELQKGSNNIRPVLASQSDRSEAALAALGEEKGVDYVVSGAYATTGANLRVQTTIFDVLRQKSLTDQAIEFFDLRDNAGEIQRKTSERILAALPLYSGVRSANAEAPELTCASAYECYLRGRQYYRWFSQDGYRQAIAAFERAVELDPTYALAYAGLAEARAFLAADLTYLSDFSDAEELLRQAAGPARQALELEPESLESLRAMAFLYLMRNFYEEADAVVRRIEQVAPDDAETLWIRGTLAADAETRLEYFQAAVDLAPNLTIARQFLGDQLREMGRAEEALPHLQAAVQQNPYALRSYDALGWAYLALGRPAEAEEQARLALALEPRYSPARYVLGFALAAQGNTVEAVVTLEDAIEASPETGMYDARLSYARPADYAPLIDFFEGLRSQQPDFAYGHNELGNYYRSAGRLDDAEAAYREALRRNPNLGIAAYNLGHLLAYERNNLVAAEQQASDALALLANLPDAHGLHGAILRQLGRYAEAEAALQKAQQLSPGIPWPRLDLAELYLDMGKQEEAEAQLQAIIDLEPAEAYPYNLWGNLLYQRGDFKKALASYQEALRRIPDDSVYMSNLAGAQLALGDLAAALASCQAASELAPESNPSGYEVCAQVHLQQGDYEAAEAAARQGLASQPRYSPLLSLLGAILNAQGRFDEADEAFGQAVDLEVHGTRALNDWGIALDSRGDWIGAAQKYEAAIERFSNDPIVMANLANAYRQMGRLDAAADLAQAAADLQPDAAWPLEVWGDALAAKRDYEQAIAKYQEALRLQPEAVSLLVKLGDAFWELGRNQEAAQAYEQAVARAPDNDYALASWGWALLNLERPAEAIEKLSAAISLDSSVLWYHVELAWAQIANGDREAAAETALAAAQIDPENEDVKALLQELGLSSP